MVDEFKSTAPKPFVFVLMPFDIDFNDIYEIGIKEAAEAAGAYAERIDKQIFTENILERLYNQINKADVVVADMTGRNPNVFYEVGYAHALGKIVILLTKKADDIPFDLQHYPHIVYGNSLSGLRSDLSKWLSVAIVESKKSSADKDVEKVSIEFNGVEIPEDSIGSSPVIIPIVIPRREFAILKWSKHISDFRDDIPTLFLTYHSIKGNNSKGNFEGHKLGYIYESIENDLEPLLGRSFGKNQSERNLADKIVKNGYISKHFLIMSNKGKNNIQDISYIYMFTENLKIVDNSYQEIIPMKEDLMYSENTLAFRYKNNYRNVLPGATEQLEFPLRISSIDNGREIKIRIITQDRTYNFSFTIVYESQK
jgi:hypothetical protein